MMARTMSGWMVAGFVLALGMAAPAAADTVMHGRVSYESGGGMVKGNADSDWGFATVNTLVLPGDTLWADSGALLEAEFNGGTFLRMADQSKADVVSLPPNAIFKGWSGSFYVHRVTRSSGNVLFQSPACQIGVAPDTQVRIDIVETGATTVTVRWGRATVGTDKGQAVVVSTAQRVYVDPGFLPSLAQGYDTSAEDDFDAWSRERARLVAMGDKALPSAYRVTSAPLGTADLSNYGDWVTVDNTPYWRPTVITNYVPYRQGIWSYTPGCGYVWVGDYPFSYVTSHYGGWNYNDSYGWLWSYADVWGPAWVASVRCGPYFAWAPLDPYGQPATCGAAVFDFGSFTLTVGAGSYCTADNLLFGYSYGLPVTAPTFSNISGNTIYAWNVSGNTVNVNYPWAGNLPVRDYKPQRVMRGPDAMTTGSRVVRAADRATTLESSITRRGFSPVERTGDRGVRTATGSRSREARMRDVGVESARTLEGARTSERVATAVSSPAGRPTREARSLGAGAQTDVTRSGREAGRDMESSRTGRTPAVDGALDTAERGTRGSRSIATEGNNVNAAPERTARQTSTPRDRTGGSVVSRTERTAPQDATRSERSISSGGTQRTMVPSEGRGHRTSAVEGGSGTRSATRSPSGAVTRTEVRSGPRAISLGSSNGSTRSMAERTPATSSGTRSIERTMGTTPRATERTVTSSPRNVERVAPAPRSVERSAPESRVISIPRSTPSRSSAAMSEPAPVRQQPMRQRMEAPAPVRQQPMRQQMEAPAPRRIEAPSAPAIQQRSVEMPRIMNRQPDPVMPQVQAPQRPDLGALRDRGIVGGIGGGTPNVDHGSSNRAIGHRAR